MAMPVSVHGGSQSLPKSQIEAVLSVPPMKVTEPRRVRHVSVTETDSSFTNYPKAKNAITKGCYQIVLCYQKPKEEDRGWFLAGWIRESLGRALLEEPLLAGRLVQRKEHDDGGDNNNNKGLEILSNDSGIRLYEARFPMSLSQFLGSTRHEKEHLEGELVFWKEIDEQSPEYSPLFYVQVTKFECGGYSIGISCSLLLADALVVENFLKKWAEIHNNLLPQKEESKAPIFYHPLLINEPPLSAVISRTPTKNGAANTVAFKITAKEVSFNTELWRGLAMLCVERAEQMLHKNVGSDFSVLVKESSEVVKVEGCLKSGNGAKVLGLESQILGATWNDFGAYDVAFHEGNKPVLASHWIGLVADGHVIALPYPEENVSAVTIVSLPSSEN